MYSRKFLLALALILLLTCMNAHAALPAYACPGGSFNVIGPAPGTISGQGAAPWNACAFPAGSMCVATGGNVYANSINPTVFLPNCGHLNVFISAGTTLTTLYSAATASPPTAQNPFSPQTLHPCPVIPFGFNGGMAIIVQGNLTAGAIGLPGGVNANTLPATFVIGSWLGSNWELSVINNGLVTGTIGMNNTTNISSAINLFGTGNTINTIPNISIDSKSITIANNTPIGFYNTGTIQTTNGITIANTGAAASAAINVGGNWSYAFGAQSGSNPATVTLRSSLNFIPTINVSNVGGASSLTMGGNITNMNGSLNVLSGASFTLGTTGAGALVSNATGNATINNSGNVLAANGILNFSNSSNTNNGTIGTTASTGTIIFSGTTQPSGGGSGNLNNSGGTLTIPSGATLTHGPAGSLTNTSFINVLGNWTIPPLIPSNTGTVFLAGGSMLGTLSGGAGSTLTLGQTSSTYTSGVGSVSSGSIFVSTSLASNTASVSTFTLGGLSSITLASNSSGSTTSSLTVNDCAAGNCTNILTGGTLTVQSGSSATFNKNFGGTSGINNSGTINISNGVNLNLSGNLTNNYTGVINIAGTGSATTLTFPGASNNVGVINLYGTGATITGPLAGTSTVVGGTTFFGTLNIGTDSANNKYTTSSYTNNVSISIPVINLNAGTFSLTAATTASNIAAFNIAAGTTATINGRINGASASSSTINVSGTLIWNPNGIFDAVGPVQAFKYILLQPNSTAIFNLISGGNPTLSSPVTGCAASITNTGCTFNLNTCCSTTGCAASSGLFSTTMNLGAATDLIVSAPISYLTNLTLGSDATATTLATTSNISNITNLTVNAGSTMQLNVNATNPLVYGVVCNITNFTLNGTLTINAGASFTMGGNGGLITGTGTINNFGQLTLSNSTFNSALSFTNQSTGTFKIIGQPVVTFTGTTFVNQGTIIVNFSANNALPSILLTNADPTVALPNGLHLDTGNLNIAYANDYIATNTYPLITALQATSPLNPGVAILPQPSFYISSWTLISQCVGGGTTCTAGTGAVIEVQVVRNGFDQHAQTPQTKQIGAFLEQIGQTGTQDPSFLYLLNALNQIQNDQQLTASLQSLVPPQYTMLVTTQRLDTMFGNIELRLANQQQGYGAADEIASIDNNFWVRPFYANGTQQTTKTIIGYTDKIQGYLIGLDKSVNNNLLLGVALGISKTNVSQINSPGTATLINSYDVNFYGTYRTSGGFYVDGLIAGGVSNYHGARTLVLPGVQQTYSSNYTSQQLTFKLLGSKPFAYDFWQFTPRFAGQYSYVRQLPYTESGSGPYANVVHPRNINLFRMGFGGSLGVPMIGANIISLPSVFAMMYIDVQGGADTVNTNFLIGGPVLTSIAQQNRLLISLGVNYELKISDHWQAAAGWAYDVRREFQGHESYINLRYSF